MKGREVQEPKGRDTTATGCPVCVFDMHMTVHTLIAHVDMVEARY